MAWEYFTANALLFKKIVAVTLLVIFWCWETLAPYFGQCEHRWRHAGRNLALALCNTIVLSVVFGSVMVAITEWTGRSGYGLLNTLPLGESVRFILALVLLDGWMYVWHRLNHRIPLLWRFHRTHHSDRHVDVTTATRFHLGEHVGSATLRLSLIPLIGFDVWHLIVYDTLVIAMTQFHHADISLGRMDLWFRTLIVTPYMHKVHHSDQQPETDSNYSTVLSIWDRLAGSFMMRSDPHTLIFGIADFQSDQWQTWSGMWKTPFVNSSHDDQSSTQEFPMEVDPALLDITKEVIYRQNDSN